MPTKRGNTEASSLDGASGASTGEAPDSDTNGEKMARCHPELIHLIIHRRILGTRTMKITFNDELKSCDSIEALGVLLDEFDQKAMFELWIEIAGGPSMSMLRHGPNAFLMYLRFAGDAEFTSRATHPRPPA
jgi:hypothetical protein